MSAAALIQMKHNFANGPYGNRFPTRDLARLISCRIACPEHRGEVIVEPNVCRRELEKALEAS